MTEPLLDGADDTDRLGIVLVNQTDKVRPEVDMLTQSLPADEFDVTVFLPEASRSTLTRYDGVDYRFYSASFVPNVRYTIPHPSFARELASELGDATVLHIIGYAFLPCIVSAAVGSRFDVETVVTIDAFVGVNWSYGNRLVDLIANCYTQTLGRLTLALADHVVGIGEYLRPQLERFASDGTERSIIPNGVDVSRYRPGDPATGDVTSDGPLELLFVGRLDTVKGIPYLLRAFADLIEDGDYRLTIVGDGSRRADYEERCQRLGIAEFVSFEGYQSDVRSYYRRCDIFVLPSLSEGLPTVLIEAQACGVPVVSTDVGGADELVRGGEIVPTRDPAALRGAIERLADADRERLGDAARRHVVANFSIDRMADAYADLYRTAARTEPYQRPR